MPPDVEPMDATVHRLHPASLLFSFLAHARRYVIPLVVVFFVTAKDGWESWFAVLLVPAMVYEIYRFLSLRYRFSADELVITDGVIWCNERHIPFARIQNIDVTQGVLQRAFGVAEVAIETASGAEPEAVLRVMALPMVEDMRRRVFGRDDRPTPASATTDGGERDADGRAACPEDGRPARELLHLTPGELLRLGLNPGRGIGVVLVLLGLAWEYDLLERIEVSAPLESAVSSASAGVAVALMAGLAFAVLVALLALSAAWHVIRLHDFRLERHAGGFRIAYGLLTRRIASVPRERIQLLAVSESVLHRCMGRVSVRIETAGGAESASEHRQWFAPLVRRGELPRLLREVHPRLELDESLSFPAGSGLDWRPLAPGARRRMLRRAVLVSIGVAAACALAFRPWGGLVLGVVLPLAAWHAVTESRFLGFARPGYGMLFRSGAWNRAWVVTFDDRIQVVTCTESPFDRRWGMATLAVDTAGAGNSGRKICVPYLARRTAGELRRELARSAEEAGFRWAPARGTPPTGKT